MREMIGGRGGEMETKKRGIEAIKSCYRRRAWSPKTESCRDRY